MGGWMRALAMLAVLAGTPALAQVRPAVTEVPRPASVIYIGNSFFYYNNGIHSHVTRLLAAAGAPPMESVMVTISGSGFGWHDVGSYFRPDAIGRYSFNADNSIRFNRRERLFDMAILMDCSQCPIHPELSRVFTEYAKRDTETVRAHGAVPVLFMSWAYQDRPEMTEQLRDAYTRAGNENRALVIPAGLAFARARAQRPEVELYVADKRHPSLAGTYLAAATIYAAVFRQSPVGLAYDAGLPPDVARFLQSVAWETVGEYYGPGSVRQGAN